MNIRPPAKAFAPFYRHTASVSGTRRENNVERPVKLPCFAHVSGGDLVQDSQGGIGPTLERAYTVLIRRADWPDHLPPQRGDILTIENYPVMNCLTCLPNGDEWSLDCRSKGELT